MKPAILVIGLDAATMDLISPWAEAGRLPALARLMREGASARLLSTPNMHSASAWTSILTGLNPGRHGLFVFSDRDFVTGRHLFFQGGDRAGDTIASHLARQKLTSGLLNVPMSFPANCNAGGFAVSGLDAPSLNEKAFCPPDLRAELLGKFPDYNFTPPGLGDLMRAGRIDEAIRAWLKLIETQTAAAEYLLASRPVDFFMTVYTASDWAGHNLWKYAFAPGSETARHAGSLLSIYEALDSAIARLLEAVDAQAQVYVISDHGMGAHTGASYHLAGWLEKNGFMKRSDQRQARATVIEAGRKAARSLLPVSIRERIKSGIGAERVKALHAAEKDSFYSSIDWDRTRAYTEPGRHVININLRGRNPRGIVSGDDYEKVREEIAERLVTWADGRGVRVVERVTRREEVYSGPFTGRASDLHVQWNPAANLGDPPDEVRARGFWWSGDHRPEGILISRGPGIKQGAGAASPTVYDLLPTIMYLAGLPVPERLDGRALQEICTDEFKARNPMRVASAKNLHTPGGSDLSQSEEQMIEDKLRGLGYL